jgi:AcrR family transcriptional regulator
MTDRSTIDDRDVVAAQQTTEIADGQPVDRRRRRHEAKRATIVAEAWELARRDGLAAISLRDLADRVDLRQPSLYAYFDSKLALYDAMFVDGYRALLHTLAEHRFAVDPREAVVEFVEILVRFSGGDVVRHQLLFQRTIRGYKPSREASHVTQGLYAVGRERLTALGVTDMATADIFTAMVAGLAHQQVFSDPGGDRWLRQVRPAMKMFFTEIDQRRTRRRSTARTRR